MAQVRILPAGPALVTVVVALALGACATPPGPEPRPAADPRVEQATQAAAEGHLDTAARLLEAAAAEASPTAAARLQLRAALVHVRRGDMVAARRLRASAGDDLDPAGDALRRLLTATLALPDDPQGALDRLEGGPPAALPSALAEYWLDSLARARRVSGDALGAARARLERADRLTIERQQGANRESLWQALLALPMETLRNRVPATRPDALGGWLELTFAVRAHRLDATAIEQAVADWRQRYPQHPAASSGFAEAALERAAAELAPPDHLAMLLPLSGRYADFGRAVQSGVMTAYYRTPTAQRPELTVLDVGGDGADSLSAYRRAMDEGADLVIGPLTKRALRRLTIWDNFPTPVLGLNRIDEAPLAAGGLYQFGLAPEDDAAAAARLAVRRGLGLTVALTPDSDWGERVHNAYADALAEAGGTLLEAHSYPADAEDFSAPIKTVFNLDASEARYARLRQVLQRRLIFEPRRRQDLDAAFIGAFPEKARLLKPQIRFHRGIDVPVLATSHAYSGTPDPEADDDMNGLMIVATPWTLAQTESGELQGARGAARETWPDVAERHARLVALGIDAFRLAARVDVLAAEPTLAMPGLTGELSVGADGVIHRALAAGRFVDGRLQPLAGDSATGDDPSAP